MTVAIENANGRRCIFCQSPGPLTREDIIPKWLGEVLHSMEPGEVTPEWGVHYTAGGLVASPLVWLSGPP